MLRDVTVLKYVHTTGGPGMWAATIRCSYIGCVGHRQGLGREPPALHPGAGLTILAQKLRRRWCFLREEHLESFDGEKRKNTDYRAGPPGEVWTLGGSYTSEQHDVKMGIQLARLSGHAPRVYCVDVHVPSHCWNPGQTSCDDWCYLLGLSHRPVPWLVY